MAIAEENKATRNINGNTLQAESVKTIDFGNGIMLTIGQSSVNPVGMWLPKCVCYDKTLWKENEVRSFLSMLVF